MNYVNRQITNACHEHTFDDQDFSMCLMSRDGKESVNLSSQQIQSILTTHRSGSLPQNELHQMREQSEVDLKTDALLAKQVGNQTNQESFKSERQKMNDTFSNEGWKKIKQF